MDSMAEDGLNDEEFSLARLRRAVLNEIHSPELLPFENGLFEHFSALIAKVSELGESVESVQEKKIIDIFRLDAERVKYYLQLYLRCRLFKIDKYYVSLLATEESSSKLSDGEKRYAANYKKIVARHLTDSFLKDIPERLRGTEEVKTDVNMVPEPNLDAPVFCRALEDIGEVILEQGAGALDMKKDTVLVLKYKYIRPFLLAKQIELL